MRKLLSKLGGAVAGPLRYAITLLLLISASLCHAQGTCLVPTISSIAPPTWYVGEANSFTVTGTNFDFGDLDSSGDYYCSASMGLTVAGKSVPTDGYFLAYSSSTTQTDGTAMIADDAPIGAATFSLEFICDPDANMPCPNGSDVGYVVWKVSYPVQLVCPIPNIISVTPSVWFAGNTYDKPVVITGTGFVTNNASAKNTCPVTAVTIAGADGTPVTVGSVKVDSKTKITLTGIAPPASSPTQTATITAGTAPNTGTPFTNAQILGAPVIAWASDPDGTAPTISGPNAALPNPIAVVGQTINLTTTPNAATLAALPVPVSFSATNPTTWTLTDGMNIGEYKVVLPVPPPSTSTVSSAKVTETVLNKPSLTTYWLYPNASVPVGYQYCVDIPNASPVRQCSPTATATFDVTGPTAQITPILTPTYPYDAIDEWSINAGYIGCTWNPPGALSDMLIFGQLVPPPATCVISVLNAGIGFLATSVNIAGVAAPNGAFEWVQILTTNQVSSALKTGGAASTFLAGTGLDNFYPTTVGDYANDSPSSGLRNILSTSTRTFTAQIYLMWNSKLDDADIPVPIGYETWSIDGTAIDTTASPPWVLSPATLSAKATTAYTPSTAQQPSYGMPIWTKVAKNTAHSASELESVPTEGEEENQQ
jgi:hypothetical protein